ncbi:hypothetical protein [Zooshikella harenae]|uniref:Uncharacterized protein n=1 Tax=Zooshikella harenae TaxID=2827238 RepID=A0ABS5ZGJ4_9GAMM|nr:hypothetical protein [Zooshikella harenae]MBU2712993.1 hypothetical protein [Zooshikella harenae]
MRIITAPPLSIKGMPAESLEAFSKAIGYTFQIEEFDESGCLYLDMYPKVSGDSIFIEPYCVSRFRRYKKLSKSFLKKQAELNATQEPSFEMKFEVVAHHNVDLEALGLKLISSDGLTGGFAVWPTQRRISGAVSIESSNKNAVAILEKIKVEIKNNHEIEAVSVSDIQLSAKS